MVFGLALIGALMVGLASSAFAANGDNYIPGVLTNCANAVTKPTGNVEGGPALPVVNSKTEPGSRGLQVNVAEGQPPILVSATAGKATNLNADKLDGKDESAFIGASTPIYVERFDFNTGVANGESQGSTACGPGDVLLAGGYSDVDAGTQTLRNTPVATPSSANPVSWALTWRSDTTVDAFTLSVYCADFPPSHTP